MVEYKRFYELFVWVMDFVKYVVDYVGYLF